jgi:hypothetical protein
MPVIATVLAITGGERSLPLNLVIPAGVVGVNAVQAAIGVAATLGEAILIVAVAVIVDLRGRMNTLDRRVRGGHRPENRDSQHGTESLHGLISLVAEGPIERPSWLAGNLS